MNRQSPGSKRTRSSGEEAWVKCLSSPQPVKMMSDCRASVLRIVPSPNSGSALEIHRCPGMIFGIGALYRLCNRGAKKKPPVAGAFWFTALGFTRLQCDCRRCGPWRRRVDACMLLHRCLYSVVLKFVDTLRADWDSNALKTISPEYRLASCSGGLLTYIGIGTGLPCV